jgi:hypothetical protein
MVIFPLFLSYNQIGLLRTKNNSASQTRKHDIQTATTTLQSSVDALEIKVSNLPITEYVQGYHEYTMVAGDAFVPIYMSPDYSSVAHVSLTILDPSLIPGDLISINGKISADSATHNIPMAELYYRVEGYSAATTFEFNCESWKIYIFGNEGSTFEVLFSATVTYNPVT